MPQWHFQFFLVFIARILVHNARVAYSEMSNIYCTNLLLSCLHSMRSALLLCFIVVPGMAFVILNLVNFEMNTQKITRADKKRTIHGVCSTVEINTRLNFTVHFRDGLFFSFFFEEEEKQVQTGEHTGYDLMKP